MIPFLVLSCQTKTNGVHRARVGMLGDVGVGRGGCEGPLRGSRERLLEFARGVGNVACAEHTVDAGPHLFVDDDFVLLIELDSQLTA